MLALLNELEFPYTFSHVLVNFYKKSCQELGGDRIGSTDSKEQYEETCHLDEIDSSNQYT